MPTTPATESAGPRPVFSLWAWLVLTPFALTALGGFDLADTLAEFGLGIGIAVVTHLLLGGAFLLVAAGERRLAARPALRWTLVAAAWVVLSVARPLGIIAMQAAFGLDLVTTEFAPRALLNGFAIIVATLAIHWLLTAVTRNTAVRRRLERVLAAVDAQAAEAEAATSALLERFRVNVAEPVLEELESLERRRLDGPALSEALRQLAHDTVRPLSHLAFDVRPTQLSSVSDATIPIAARRRRVRLPRIRPVPWWLTTAMATAIGLGPAIGIHGMRTGLALLLLAAAASALGTGLLRHMPIPARPIPGAVFVTLWFLVLGVLVSLAVVGPLLPTANGWLYMTTGTLGYTVAAVAVTIARSSSAEVRQYEGELANALALADRRAAAAQQRLVASAQRVARLLHTHVQGDILATSIRLRLGTAGGDALPELIARVRDTLLDPLAEELEVTPESVRSGIESSLQSWRRVLELDISLDEAAWNALAARPQAAEVLLDALTEALTNAVRHSTAPTAGVAIDAVDDHVELTVRNHAKLVSRSGDGVGLKDLADRAESLSLRQDGDEVVLKVAV